MEMKWVSGVREGSRVKFSGKKMERNRMELRKESDLICM